MSRENLRHCQRLSMVWMWSVKFLSFWFFLCPCSTSLIQFSAHFLFFQGSALSPQLWEPLKDRFLEFLSQGGEKNLHVSSLLWSPVLHAFWISGCKFLSMEPGIVLLGMAIMLLWKIKKYIVNKIPVPQGTHLCDPEQFGNWVHCPAGHEATVFEGVGFDECLNPKFWI